MFNYRIKNNENVVYSLNNTDISFNKQYPINASARISLAEQDIVTDCTSLFSFNINVFDVNNDGVAADLIAALEAIKATENYHLVIEVALHNNEDTIEYAKIINTSKIDLITSGTNFIREDNNQRGTIIGSEEVVSFLFV